MRRPSVGRCVSKDQLIGRVWPDTVVDEIALRVHVAAIRKALGDGREGNRFIVSESGRDYSFVAPLTRRPPINSAAAAAPTQARSTSSVRRAAKAATDFEYVHAGPYARTFRTLARCHDTRRTASVLRQ